MQEGKNEGKRKRWARFIEMLIDVVTAGKSGHATCRMYLSGVEEEMIRRMRKKLSKSELEHEYDTAK